MHKHIRAPSACVYVEYTTSYESTNLWSDAIKPDWQNAFTHFIQFLCFCFLFPFFFSCRKSSHWQRATAHVFCTMLSPGGAHVNHFAWHFLITEPRILFQSLFADVLKNQWMDDKYFGIVLFCCSQRSFDFDCSVRWRSIQLKISSRPVPLNARTYPNSSIFPKWDVILNELSMNEWVVV